METKNRIAATLALIVLFDFSLMLAFLVFGTVNSANKDFLNMMLVALISFVNIGFGYFLGSSVGSFRKTDLMAQPDVVLPETLPARTVPESRVPSPESGFISLRLLPLISLAFGLMFVASLALMNGCATTGKETPQGIAAKSLLTMKETIVAAAVIGDQLCKQDALSPEQCEKLAVVYAQAGPAYDLAADSLQLAITAGGDGDAMERYRQSVLHFNAIFADVLDLSAKLGIVPQIETSFSRSPVPGPRSPISGGAK